MWSTLSPQWQCVFEQAVRAFREGNIPIGAALFDENGGLVAADRNRINNDSRTKGIKGLNSRLSHAEINVLRLLDTSEYDPDSLTLYTTMEPCPMCMGTALMSNIRHIRYAALDPYCGMTHLAQSEPYYMSKQIDCCHEGGEAEQFQLAMQCITELRRLSDGKSDVVYRQFKSYAPKAAAAAERLYNNSTFAKLEGELLADELYDFIISEIRI